MKPIAVGIRRGDDDLRILVDRTLSQLYRSPEITKLYATWFGTPGLATDIFYQLSGLPD
jgi:putrescine:ornithine antiporter